MNKQLVVVGTDTSCGKTVITGLIAHYFNQQDGLSVSTQKWVQTGSVQDNDLAQHDYYAPSLTPFPSNIRCPYSFPDPVSPHWAATLANKTISLDRIKTTCYAMAKQVDLLICETSGGIMVPYTESENQLDLLIQLNIPIIVVAANRLGTLNHTFLTVNTLLANQLTVCGVILSQPDPLVEEALIKNNELTLQNRLAVPVLGTVPHSSSLSSLRESFNDIGLKLVPPLERQ